MSKTGFYAVAENRNDTKTVIVRARVKNDLERFRDFLPGAPRVTYHEDYDYPYRLIITKAEFVDVMSKMAADIDYSNFKSYITKRFGHARHMVYMTVWSALKKLEANAKRLDKYWDRQMTLFEREGWTSNSKYGTTYSDRDTTKPYRSLGNGRILHDLHPRDMVTHSDD